MVYYVRVYHTQYIQSNSTFNVVKFPFSDCSYSSILDTDLSLYWILNCTVTKLFFRISLFIECSNTVNKFMYESFSLN